jgi:hypothetical protein
MRALALLAPVAAGAWLLLSPAPAQADCTTPELPVVGCPVAGPSASPTPTGPASPAAVPSPTATSTADVPAPALTGAPAAVVPAAGLAAPVGVPAAGQAPATSTVVVPPPAVQPLPGQVVLRRAEQRPVTAATVSLAGTVASSFALVSFGLLAVPLLLGFLAGLRPAAPAPGGTVNTHRTRLWTGLGVLALAALVGGVGWYRLSGEPLLNRQIPFLASAGILVVLLSVLGGSLIVAEQLRGDQQRMTDLEDAVRALTEALSPMVELPARRTGAEEAVSPPAARRRSQRAGAGST